MGALDARPLLPAVTAPTLVLVGEEDYATPVADAATLTAGIPGATLRVLAGLRHLSLVERPELAADIAEHLRSAPAAEHPRSAPAGEHPRSAPGGEHPRSAPAGGLVDGGAGGAR
jgi:3-oxoadipate enol-lactonase